MPKEPWSPPGLVSWGYTGCPFKNTIAWQSGCCALQRILPCNFCRKLFFSHMESCGSLIVQHNYDSGGERLQIAWKLSAINHIQKFKSWKIWNYTLGDAKEQFYPRPTVSIIYTEQLWPYWCAMIMRHIWSESICVQSSLQQHMWHLKNIISHAAVLT